MPAKKRAKLHQQQPYDSTLKSLFEEQTDEMISFIVEGAEYLQELSGEALKPPLRADRTYLVSNKGEECVAHFELQAGSDSEIVHRLLEYYGILYRKHKKPIISIVIYPFRTTIPQPPLRITSGDREILVFHYRVLALWELEAQRYLDQHRVRLYALLPTMDGATYEVLAQALDEMKEFYTGQSRKLATQLLWFGMFLQRTDTVSPEDKRRIVQKMEQFDSLLEQNPFVQKKSTEAEVRTLQKTLVKFVRGRYPALIDLAQQRAKQADKPDELDLLIDQLFAAPDEEHVRQLLSPTEV